MANVRPHELVLVPALVLVLVMIMVLVLVSVLVLASTGIGISTCVYLPGPSYLHSHPCILV